VEGLTLKHYRDRAQHHAVVASDARVPRLADGQAFIYLVLPRNPEEANPARLDYGPPHVHALLYCERSLCALFAFVFELTHVLLSYTTVPPHEVMTLEFKGPLRGAIDGHPAVTGQTIEQALAATAAELGPRLDAERPRGFAHSW